MRSGMWTAMMFMCVAETPSSFIHFLTFVVDGAECASLPFTVVFTCTLQDLMTISRQDVCILYGGEGRTLTCLMCMHVHVLNFSVLILSDVNFHVPHTTADLQLFPMTTATMKPLTQTQLPWRQEVLPPKTVNHHPKPRCRRSRTTGDVSSALWKEMHPAW